MIGSNSNTPTLTGANIKSSSKNNFQHKQQQQQKPQKQKVKNSLARVLNYDPFARTVGWTYKIALLRITIALERTYFRHQEQGEEQQQPHRKHYRAFPQRAHFYLHFCERGGLHSPTHATRSLSHSPPHPLQTIAGKHSHSLTYLTRYLSAGWDGQKNQFNTFQMDWN